MSERAYRLDDWKQDVIGIAGELVDSRLADEHSWHDGANLVAEATNCTSRYIYAGKSECRAVVASAELHNDGEARQLSSFLNDQYNLYLQGERSSELTRRLLLGG